MRPSPIARLGRIRPLVVLLTAGLALACEPPTPPGRIRSLALDVPSTELRPGNFMRVAAQPLDVMGEVVEGETVRWRSMTPAILDVSADGLVLATGPGIGVARASVGPIHADVQLALVNPPIAQLRIDLDTVILQTPGAPHQLVAKAYDALGIGIVRPELVWESTAPRFATIGPTGLVSPIAVGRSTVSVRGEGRSDSVEIVVQAQPSASAPVVSFIAPATAIPGQPMVITGFGFASSASGNFVLVDGVPVAVTAASATQLTLALPPATSFVCQPTRNVTLQVGTSGGIGVATVALTVATARTLTVGQSLTLAASGEGRCNALTPAPGRYLVTLPNAARTFGTGMNAIGVSLRGEAAGGVALAQASATASAKPRAVDGREWLRGGRVRARDRAHARLLGENAAIASTARTARPRATRTRSATANAALTAPALGSILTVRVPAIGQSDFCSAYASIGARVVHVGDHLVILEDTATVAEYGPTLARQMDADYDLLGAELEARGWPVLQTFGDPLVMDSRLDDNGRVMVVFTPRINARLDGSILATVVTCDFFSRSEFSASNVGEFLYAQVPTSLSDAMVTGARARWRYEMRATIVHELKHVTSYAERIIRGQALEEGWLEEATARHAEELYARSAYGFARGSNAGFSASLACELVANDPAYPACADAPRAMRPHLEALWEFLDAPAAHSPLGGLSGDFSYYGSGWAFTRWLADLDAPNEPAFFTALSVNRQAGIANLEARTGRAWADLLVDWSLAMVSDDLAGFAPQSARQHFGAFDLRSIFQGLCDVAGSCIAPRASPFSRPWPVVPLTLQAGAFDVEFAAIAPGGFAVVELVIPPGIGAQSIEVRGYRGAPLPATARIGILRIQ